MWKPSKSTYVSATLALFMAGSLAIGAHADSVKSDSNHEHQMSSAAAPPAGGSGLIAWDETASRDLEHELHRLHDIWNTGDIASLKKYIIGDAVLPTFELDPLTHEPVILSSKVDLDKFISSTLSTLSDRRLKTKLAHPVTHCRATKTWGICTEECTVSYERSEDGKLLAVDKLRATQIAVLTPDGWRWIQWHMSDTRRPQSVSLH